MDGNHWFDPPPGPTLSPVEIAVATALSPDEAVAAIAGGIREKRYWDPRRSEAPFLRLHGGITGPDFDLRARCYGLPGIRNRDATLRVQGSIRPVGTGAVLTARVSGPDPWPLESLPVLGKLIVEGEQRLLAIKVEGVRELIASMLGAPA